MRGLNRLGKNLITITISILVIFSYTHLALASEITPENIIRLTNQKRIENNVTPLSVSPLLTKAAINKAHDMATRGYWSHTTPEGEPFWAFANKQGYDWKYLGENLAADFDTAEAATNAWLKSPPHRKNILNQNYQEIGVGVSKNIVVVMFGRKSTEHFELVKKIPALLINIFSSIFNF